MSAPNLNAAESPVITAVNENTINPAGISIAALVVDGSISDTDGAVEAIAIEALNTSLGTWQYSLDGGANWLTVQADLLNSSTNTLGLLLGPNNLIRLLPFGDLNGTLANAITFRAWDMSAGSAGQYVVTTPGSGAFSSASDTASITVTAVNDAPTFAPVAGGGKLLVPVGPSFDIGLSAGLQPDGKIILTGYSANGSNDVSLIRLNSDGSLDSSFDGDGKLTVPVSPAADDSYGFSLQPDGKILVVGTSFLLGGGFGIGVIRLNIDGTLDTSFDGDGKQTVSLSGSNSSSAGYSISLQTDGKIIVAGKNQANSNDDFGLIRLNANGSLDTSFDGDGKLIVPVGAGIDFGRSISLQADGKIVMAGYSSTANGTNFSLIRLNVDGSLDTSFDGDGKLLVPIGTASAYGFSIALQPDGKIIVAGYAENVATYDFSLIRLNTDGSLDTSLDGDGKLLLPVGSFNDKAYSLALQSDGKIVVAGFSASSAGASDATDFSLIRLNANGSLDTSFDGDGKLIVPVGNSSDEGQSVSLQPDGKIIVAGYSNNGTDNDFSLIRLNPNGSLDTSFAGSAVNTLGSAINTTPGDAAVVLDSNVTLVDADLTALNAGVGNYNGASLTLVRNGGTNSQDLFSAKTGGTLAALTQGASLVVDGITIGSVSTNAGGTLVLTFNGNATQALLNSAMRQLAYSNSQIGATGSAQLDWTFSDGNGGVQGAGSALGVTSNVTVNFTADVTAPTVLTFSPADEATAVAVGANISLTFSEAIARGTGNILLKNAGGTVIETFAAASSPNLTILGNVLTVNPSADLAAGTGYRLEFAAGTITDLVGNSYAGTVSYNFATVASDTTAPTVTITDNTPGTASGSVTYTLTFSESVTGLASNDVTVSNGAVSSVTGSGALYSVLVSPTAGLGGSMTFTLLASAVTDAAGNPNQAAIAATQPIDTRPPTANAFSPTDEATAVAITSNIGAVFSEAIQRGTGNILLKNAAGTVIETFAAASSPNLTISNNVLTVNPTSDLAAGTGYSLEFAAGTITDLAGNNYAGTTSYNFTTVAADTQAPTVSTFSPTDEATAVATTSNVIVTFNEAIQRGTGTIVLKTTSGVVVESFDAATSPRVTVAGSTLTLDPTANLIGGAGYRVEFGAGSVRDVAGNNYLGTTSYNFTTDNADDYLATSATTGVVAIGGSSTGTVEATSDKDWFAVTLTAGQAYSFELNAAATNGLVDPYLTLYNSSATVLKTDDDSGSGVNSLMSYTAASSGIYYLEARAYGVGVGGYMLLANLAPGDVAAPIVSNFYPADESIGFSVSGNISVTFDEPIIRGAGNIVLKTALGATLATYDPASPNVTISGNVLTINPAVNLDYSSGYQVEFTAGSVKDLAGNNYAGITSYNFSTGAEGIILNGTAGPDDLIGNTGDDSITGLAGDDTLDGGAGDDTLSGGDGVDVFVGGSGTDLVDGGNGVDLLSYENAISAVTVNLATGIVSGGEGIDFLIGVEMVAGSFFSDAITGSAGDDFIEGLAGNDTLIGGAGRDSLMYSSATSGVTVNLVTGSVSGGAGNDVVSQFEIVGGSSFADHITGGAGAEVMHGAAGNDTLVGGAGDDSFLGDTGDDSMDGGTGFDQVTYINASAAVTVNLGTGVATGGDGADSLFQMEAVVGSNYNDSLTGSASGDELRGANGNDTLRGGFGNDSLVGGAGDDLIDGGSDGIGNFDTVYYFEASAGVTIDLAAGLATGGDGTDSLIELEAAYGSAYADAIFGSSVGNNLTGLAGNDTLHGGAGDDSLSGGLGDDLIDGGAGFDAVYYETAAAAVSVNLATGIVTGGEGNDTLVSVEVVLGSAYADLITGGAGNDAIDGLGGNDTLTGGAGTDYLSYFVSPSGVVVNLSTGSASGGQGNDVLSQFENLGGSNFADNLIGDRGANRIWGEAGNDTLIGMDGNDSLTGGPGNDSLDGGAGSDTAYFTGSASSYSVIYNEATGVYTVSSLAEGTDTITRVEYFHFGIAISAQQKATRFSGVVQDGYVSGAAISIDGNGNGVADSGEATGVEADAQGRFSGNHYLEGGILAVGGTNIDTRLHNHLVLSAPHDASVVNPITTLIQAFATQAGTGPSEAEAYVQAALGLVGDIDLTQYDPLAQAPGNATALSVQRVNAQLATLGTHAQFNGSSFKAVVDALTLEIRSGRNVNLADRDQLHSLLGPFISSTVIDAAATTNAAIAAATSFQAVSNLQAAPVSSNNPMVSRFNPGDGAVGVDVASNLVISFSEAIARGTGFITLKTTSGTVVASYNAATSSNLTISDNTLTINPSSDLALNTGYKLEFVSGAIKDLAGNAYAGTTSYNFTTIAASQTLNGTSAANSLTGGSGHDTFTGAGGNDSIDGGVGTDTAFYTGTRASHNLSKVVTSVVVADTVPNRNGTDTLVNVETLRFSDMTVDLTMGAKSLTISAANLKTLEEIYVGFFNRVPEAGGMAYWIGEIASGVTMKQVADRAYDAGVQYSDLTGYTANMTTVAYITKIYANVFGRSGATAPNADEIGYWANWLTEPGHTRGNMVLQMLSDVHTHFETSVQWGWVASLLNNKAAVANYYAVEQGLSFLDAASNITFGMQVAALITPTDTSAAIALIGVDEFSTLG